MKLDLHLHTQYSPDAIGTPRNIAQLLKKKGFHGMAITDHNTVKGALKIQKDPPLDFIIIPGCEISTSQGHILALGINKEIKKGLAPQETIEKIQDSGGLAIIPHPFRLFTGIKKKFSHADAIETFNGRCSYWCNLQAYKLAIQCQTAHTGGSDAHNPTEAGNGYTLIDDVTTPDDVLTKIQKKTTQGTGKIQLPFKYPLKSAISFAKRGFQRI
jgi:predicted metal-dependent phosphoesterase TrpH